MFKGRNEVLAECGRARVGSTDKKKCDKKNDQPIESGVKIQRMPFFARKSISGSFVFFDKAISSNNREQEQRGQAELHVRIGSEIALMSRGFVIALNLGLNFRNGRQLFLGGIGGENFARVFRDRTGF